MRMAAFVVGGLFGSVILIAVTIFFMYFHYTNKEVRMRQAIVSQVESNSASFDNMWKILQSQAGVTEEYKKPFEKMYELIIQGRKDSDKLLVKFITESNPTFNVSLLKKLMTSITAERNRFLNEQKKLVQLVQDYKTTFSQVPAVWFVTMNVPEYKIITSDKTEEVFKTGKDNDVDLFNKKKD